MNPTITKLEKRVSMLENLLDDIVYVYNDVDSVHDRRKLDRLIKRAEKAGVQFAGVGPADNKKAELLSDLKTCLDWIADGADDPDGQALLVEPLRAKYFGQ